MEKQEVSFRSDGIRLAGEVYLPHGSGYPGLIICHGIPSGQPPDPADAGYPGLAAHFAEAGFGVLIFNFRGAGLSEGNFDLVGWARDLRTALEFWLFQDEADPARLSVMGFSGGASTAAVVAATDERVRSLCLCACPAQPFNFLDGERWQQFLTQARQSGIVRDPDFPADPVAWAQGMASLRPLEAVSRLGGRPLLIVHGEADEVVPVDNAARLYEAASLPKELKIITGAGHRLRHSPEAMAAALAWLKKVNGLS